jgi:hypothetical protein
MNDFIDFSFCRKLPRKSKFSWFNRLSEDVILRVCVNDDNKLGEDVGNLLPFVYKLWLLEEWLIAVSHLLPRVFLLFVVAGLEIVLLV